MIDVNSSLKKAASSCGLARVRYKEKNIPTSIENIVIFVFFGDHRSNFILSSLLLRRIKEESKSSKYFILVSWPGNEGLYPFVDEYWQIEDESSLSKLKNDTFGFFNNSPIFTFILRSLNQHFYDVMTYGDLIPFYENGIKKEFFEKFKHIKVSLPSIPSVASINLDLARSLERTQSKVFVYPSRNIYSWKNGNLFSFISPKEFWSELLNFLVENKFNPIVYSDIFSHDLSNDNLENCNYIKNIDLIKTLGVMRSCGCVLDFFNGISRYAIAARTPFIVFDERIKFNSIKDYEINDLFANKIPKEYIFGFSAIVEGGNKSLWRSNFFEHLIVKLNKLYSATNRDLLPSSSEMNEIIPYDSVRKIKNKKLGTRFISIKEDRY